MLEGKKSTNLNIKSYFHKAYDNEDRRLPEKGENTSRDKSKVTFVWSYFVQNIFCVLAIYLAKIYKTDISVIR